MYPELVVRDATTGRIDGVRYDELAPMLLNEVQQQQSKMTAQAENMAAQAERIAAQDQHSAAQDAQIHELKQQVAELKNLKQEMAAISAALRKIQTKDALVARR